YLPDRRDLNRYFPGSARGSVASRIAYSFFRDIVRHCDMLVDFHTGSFERSNLPQVRADLTRQEVLEFGRGFGNTVGRHSPRSRRRVPPDRTRRDVLESGPGFGNAVVPHRPGNRGMLRVAATDAGIPAVTFEAGSPQRLETAEIAESVAAIERLMVKLGMLE